MDYRDYYFNNRKYLHDVFIQTDNIMLGTIIDFAKLAIRGAFLLNGAAAIAALGMFTEVLLKYPGLGKDFYLVVACLGIGAFLASCASCMAYFTQKKYQSANAEHVQSEIYKTNIQMIIQQLKDNNYPKKNMSDLEKVELGDMKQAIENSEEQQKISIANSSQHEKTGNWLCTASIGLIVASYASFGGALYLGYRALSLL